MGRSPCCEKEGLKKGPWTPEEDQKLLAYIEQHGHGSWRALPAKAGLQRCGKSCRLRWTNYLRPDIKRGKFSLKEEQTIIQLHALLGNRWSAIASHLPKRTDNEIKNFWNTHLKKRLAKMGIDPVTHKPKCDALSPADGNGSKTAANLSHMAQWESARLEAEARLVRESRLVSSSALLNAAASSATTSVCSSSPNAPFQLSTFSWTATTSTVERHNVLPSASPSSVPLPCPDVHRSWPGTCTKPMSVDDGSQSSRVLGKIDLESPTSTLSYSENFLPVGATGFRERVSSVGHQDSGPGSGTGGGGGSEDNEGEEVDWKCFPTPMQLFDHKERTESFMRSTFPGISSSVFGSSDINVSWLPEPFKIGLQASAPTATGNFGDGFTEMLLHDSDRHSSGEDAGGGCDEFADTNEKGSGTAEINEEENKSYWNSILNLVNSSSPSDSQTGF